MLLLSESFGDLKIYFPQPVWSFLQSSCLDKEEAYFLLGGKELHWIGSLHVVGSLVLNFIGQLNSFFNKR